MLYIRPIMNTSVEEIFDFKTCCGLRMFDQNLEIHVRNLGDSPVIIPGYFDLEGEHGSKRFDTLSPAGEHRISPGEIMSFYCYMDESLWSKARRLVFYDSEGTGYEVGIYHDSSVGSSD
jgi:hypothetical protein